MVKIKRVIIFNVRSATKIEFSVLVWGKYMIIKLRSNVQEAQLKELIARIEKRGLTVECSKGNEIQLIEVIGNTEKVDLSEILKMDCVDEVFRKQDNAKKFSRQYKPQDTIITLENGTKIGGGNFLLIAGPCSVESEEQVIEIAKSVKKSGANVLRGGAFKPRTSPYDFQGIGMDGLKILSKAKAETGLPIVSEIMNINLLDQYDDVDILQVGARNMQNFELLKELGRVNKPILLKRGLSATYNELLSSAEYILNAGNPNVILCERGIRTFETFTRNTLDISSVPVLHEKTHLPVIIDPSHAAGMARMVRPLSLGAVGAGADGLIIEVHNDPENALCDGAQSLRPEEFERTARDVFKLRKTLSEF
ncbi:3-deoxy-D-arabinoheptulosonate-7-phosphate synthase [Peptoniphilus asaccharolyticus DSM 20463]|uniref:3-deoxy-D-arabinoheptulosonate-7-phosphate synthase n=2 Tax=Peptoniphilus asaccharolyticus TaxID=1258 RepID=A0A1W1VHW7_PEPAS|nr:3-deoxy-D-arabinoheptulosonate-7-phosphate synthase [Peptoniphilus asaccharolyticus DSM 20463]